MMQVVLELASMLWFCYMTRKDEHRHLQILAGVAFITVVVRGTIAQIATLVLSR